MTGGDAGMTGEGRGEGARGSQDGGWWHSGLKIPAFAGMTGEGRGRGLEVRRTGVGGTPGSRFPRSETFAQPLVSSPKWIERG